MGFEFGVGLVDRRADFADVGLFLDVVVGDAHRVEDRLDDAHAVALGLPRHHADLLFQQADHHADRQIVFDRVAADGVDGVEQAGLLDQQQPALAGEGQTGADRDALVLLADADQPRVASSWRAAAAGPRWW